MSHISEHIFKLYNQLSEDEIQPIDDDVVVNAINIINRISVNNSDSLFYFLTAMNLLNAAIKTAQHKSQLSHAFIKTRVSKIADKILQNPSSFTETYLFYDNAQKCMYFEVYDVIFSFHQILETKLIKNIASKRNRIQWTGIRLQRIAQNIYLYAEQLFDNSCKDDSEMKSIVINKINNEKKFDEASNTKLFPCPDCGKEISIHAKMCPQCGNDLCANNELMDGIKEGYSIKITFNGNSNSGVLKTMDRHFVTLALIDEKWVKIRTSAIDSIELIDTNEISTELLAQQAEAFFLRIFELSNIDKETLISTNSTITQVDKLGLTIIKDSGEIATCVKPRIVGYKKKECTIGKRVYCGNIGTKGKCYNSIVEMTYGGLVGFFHKAISNSQNITQAKRAQIMSILTYLMKEITTNPEVYLEIRNFKKKVKDFLGQLNLECDNFSEQEEPLENNKEANSIYSGNKVSQETHIYKTETEKLLEGDGLPKLKVLGKIDLDAHSGGKNMSSSSTPNDVTISELSKPMILYSAEVSKFINKKLINLSEVKCKQLEKELDTLIRNGEKEECLRRSYQIINTSRPTPKYLRSYLDRIVNTEIALDHTSEALQSLAFLIILTEQQEDASESSLCHLYITMARLYLKEQNKDEALKAILYAESLRPNNNAISKLRDSIFQMGENTAELKRDAQDIPISNENTNTNDDSISRMLLEDVRQEAKRQELLPVNAIIPAEQLFGKAQNNRNNSTESFEEKAQLFLEAAGAYYNSKQTSTIMYKISVAYYARLKGHSMYAKFANLIRNNSGELIELQAYRDSACSYYLESLGIFNVLEEKNYLQELFLKYLQLSIVVSNIEGGKTPADNWEQWTLNQLQLDCIKADGLEEKRILFKTCISVGTAAEGAWNTLYKDKDGLSPFISRFGSPKFKEESFSLFNDIEKSEISSDLQPGTFLHKIFEHRQDSLNRINEIIEDCLKWQYSSFDISTFELIFKKIENYRELFTSTDLKAITAVNEVIEILKPYAGRKENERTRSLVRSQQVLLNTQKDISSTTTFYGKRMTKKAKNSRFELLF
ncbi:zinc ribbon domain-containing protein [Leyella stercorea]|uniref:zinc ribbon domain-containing protein n=1 Tax=Leyella stercorea TaxID=363265 RepID=UPI00266D4C4C|nr:zinc ribbon domain-containing protein [Leyella stercorea]